MPRDVSRVSAPTEQRHPGTAAIDTEPTLQVLQRINAEDALVAPAVERTLPELARLVDRAVDTVRGGGTVHYFGAGTSGRLAVLDAAELLPTFNVPEGLVVAHHAGGPAALLRAVEDVEDDAEQGAADARDVRSGDVVIGLAASGRTPYVAGALRRAREVGAVTALVTADPQAELATLADHVIAPDTGPEALTGSTRLKAGTAQKMVLNAFSTALMVRLGRTWSNLMVDLVATNAKLRGRVLRILQEATGADEETARVALEEAGGELKPALLSMLAGCSADEARSALDGQHGSVAAALATLSGGGSTPATAAGGQPS
ncbi:N-acetylmuramic acid 6-phosphate etherase [Pedococcus sp. NPDC057267]|uniref:N-acetylmuramic acid 6-phosphate etherase n=1 Tax=Pedococcus sp. NPDC057267 TaxID=3346077 RepID=UPI00363F7B14